MHVCCEEPRTQGEKALIVTSLPIPFAPSSHSRMTSPASSCSKAAKVEVQENSQRFSPWEGG